MATDLNINISVETGPLTEAIDNILQTFPLKALFIPIKAKYFHGFACGMKSEEFRPYGPRWNERTCPIGRPVTLSKGYGKRERLHGIIVGTRICEPTEAFLAIYGLGRECFAIAIELRKIYSK
jgi:hypothetical protein